jgi:hypothetical protein
MFLNSYLADKSQAKANIFIIMVIKLGKPSKTVLRLDAPLRYVLITITKKRQAVNSCPAKG